MLRGANMLRGKGPAGLILAGLAAFAYYKYSKMSPQQRQDLVNNIKEKGKKLYEQFIPSKQGNPSTAGTNNFGEGSQYTG